MADIIDFFKKKMESTAQDNVVESVNDVIEHLDFLKEELGKHKDFKAKRSIFIAVGDDEEELFISTSEVPNLLRDLGTLEAVKSTMLMGRNVGSN